MPLRLPPLSARRTARSRRWRLAFAAAAGMALGAAPARAQVSCDPCAIGVVFDGPWEHNEEFRAAFEREVLDLAAPRFTAVFPPEKTLLGDWTPEVVHEAVETLLADAEVALVLTAGPVASSLAVGQEELPKPVVAAFVFDPEVRGFPIRTTEDGERVSGVPNLSYLTFAGDAAGEFRRLREIVPFTRLAYLVNDALIAAVPAAAGNLRGVAAGLDLALEIVPAGRSADAVIAAIPPDAEAVYVSPLPQLPPGEFDRLVAALIERRLPSFSWWGRSEVERGLLTSTYRDDDLPRLARRVALHVQRILRGEDAGALPVDFRRSRGWTLNLETARAIGVEPGWEVLREAELLHEERTDVVRRLDLAGAAHEAVAANLDLAASVQTVAAGRQAARAARAALFPQLTASGSGQTIDEDRAAASFGSMPRWTVAGALGASQLLYSDAAWANAGIQGHLQESREHSHEELRLDIAHSGALAYLDVLRAEAFERLQRENLAVTRANLEFARSRQRIGVARASEVIRWENEIAGNRRELVEAGARRRAAGIALNRLLDRPLEERFRTTGISPDDPELVLSSAAIGRYAQHPAAYARLRDFMVQEALRQSPELRGLDATLAARERAVLAARRAFWLPTLAARGDLTAFRTAGADAGGNGPAPVTANPYNWTLGLSASLPLFAGGARFAERVRAEREMDGLRLTRRATAARLGQRVRTAMHFALASFMGIELAGDARDAAWRNLELTSDAYEQGAVPILDLLDAQRAALNAEQAEINAVYDYLGDVLDAQRAIGRFGFFMSPEELGALTRRLRDYFDEAGDP